MNREGCIDAWDYDVPVPPVEVGPAFVDWIHTGFRALDIGLWMGDPVPPVERASWLSRWTGPVPGDIAKFYDLATPFPGPEVHAYDDWTGSRALKAASIETALPLYIASNLAAVAIPFGDGYRVEEFEGGSEPILVARDLWHFWLASVAIEAEWDDLPHITPYPDLCALPRVQRFLGL